MYCTLIVKTHIFKNAFSDGVVSEDIRDELSVNIEVSPHLELCHHQSMVSDEDGIPMVRITVSLSSSTPLAKIRVGIDVCEPMVSTRSSFIVQSLSSFFYNYNASGPNFLA